MLRLAMAVCLILAVTVGGHAHARMAGDAHAAGERGEDCCDDRADPHRTATTHCTDTILIEPIRPPAAAGRGLRPQRSACALPEGREPADPLQPPNPPS